MGGMYRVTEALTTIAERFTTILREDGGNAIWPFDGTGTVTLQGNNTFTGTLYVDSSSTTGNDGVLKLKSSSAVASAASPIYIRNNTSGSSTFQLDGSGGNMLMVAEGGARPVKEAIQPRKRRRWPSGSRAPRWAA